MKVGDLVENIVDRNACGTSKYKGRIIGETKLYWKLRLRFKLLDGSVNEQIRRFRKSDLRDPSTDSYTNSYIREIESKVKV